MQQAEDRCHRIGQDESVLVQILVFDGTLDANLAQMVLGKQEVIDATLDTEAVDPISEEVGALAAEAAETVARKVERKDRTGVLAENNLTIEQVRAIHQCLQILAGNDPDRCALKNDAGFNALDGAFGHALAEQPGLTVKQALAARKMLPKYHRQLPVEVLTVAMGR
jgi:hypothetical protein